MRVGGIEEIRKRIGIVNMAITSFAKVRETHDDITVDTKIQQIGRSFRLHLNFGIEMWRCERRRYV